MEILIVDDGSGDDTLAFLERVIGSLPATERLVVRVLPMPANGGPGAARNFGVASSLADVVFFCDADDTYHEDHVSACATALDACPGMSRLHERGVWSEVGFLSVSASERLDSCVKVGGRVHARMRRRTHVGADEHAGAAALGGCGVQHDPRCVPCR